MFSWAPWLSKLQWYNNSLALIIVNRDNSPLHIHFLQHVIVMPRVQNHKNVMIRVNVLIAIPLLLEINVKYVLLVILISQNVTNVPMGIMVFQIAKVNKFLML